MLFIKQGFACFWKPFNLLTVEKEMSGKVMGTTKPGGKKKEHLQQMWVLSVPYQDKCHEGQRL